MAEGDDDQIAALRELVASKRPKDARVSDVAIEEYDGRIVSTTDFMHIIQVQQLNKGIPAILRIQTTQEKMLEKQCMMLDKQDQMLDKQDQMLDKQETTISILKNIKEDTSEIGVIKKEVSAARYEARREREEIISTLKSGSLEEKYEELSREIAEIKAAIAEIRAKVS